MRIATLLGSSTLLAAAPVAANEEDLNLDLLSCIGLTNAAFGLGMAVSITDEGLSREIDAALSEREAVTIALITRLWEQTNCTVAYDQVVDAIESASRDAIRPVNAAIGDRSALFDIWNDIEPQLACHDELSEEELNAARAVVANESGYPCGWEP